MGFMDKAKKFAEQAQQQARDGTLKDRAKALADQAQQKLDDVQGQFNERQKADAVPPAEPAAQAEPAPPATPPAPAPEAVPDVDRSGEAAPKLTGGDPLAS